MDVYPTLAGLARVEVPRAARIQGQDLSRALRGKARFPQLRAYSHGTLRQWSFFVPDVIENIGAAERIGDRLYTWRREGSQWQFDVRHVGKAGGGVSTLDLKDPADRAVASDLWDYRQRLIEAFYRWYPEQAKSKEEALSRLSEERKEVLRSLGYIE